MSQDIDDLLKMLGGCTLFGLVVLFANRYETLFLSLFWGAIIAVIVVPWWAERRKKR